MGVSVKGSYRSFSSPRFGNPPPSDPLWLTPSGLLATGNEGTAIDAQVEVQDRSGKGLTYTFASTPPAGFILNPSTGQIIGTYPAVGTGVGTTKDFEISILATDGNGLSTPPRTFILRSSYYSVPSIVSGFRFTDSLTDVNGNSPFSISSGGEAVIAETTSPSGEPSTALAMSNNTYLYRASVGTSYAFLITAPSTVEFWFKVPNPLVTGNKRLFSIGADALSFLRLDGNTNGTNDYKYHFDITGSSALTGAVEPTPGEWSHFALTHDGAGHWVQYNNGASGNPLTRVISAAAFNNVAMAINTYAPFNNTTYSYPTAVIRGLCFHNRMKYTGNFTPNWDNYLD